jgi:hypothetical protein
MADNAREQALEAALYRLYQRWHRELGYRAERFRQTIDPNCKNYKGGIAAVRALLLKPGTAGFEFLTEANRPDLTVEHLVLQPEWDDLFDDSDRRLAEQKLRSKSLGTITAKG